MPISGASSRPEHILNFEEAHQLVLKHAKGLGGLPWQTESAALLDSLGRTLAEDIVADRDLPPFPRSTRDGYAVQSQDVQSPFSELTVVGEVRAGGELPHAFTKLAAGEAVSIMTGAPVPAGADSVVMVEYSQRQGNRVRLSRSAVPGENVVPRGNEARAGAILAPRGTIVTFPQIALAAAVGRTSLKVARRPRIAILPTGDEIVPIDSDPGPNQIRNSNSYSLAAQVLSSGGEPVQLPIAPDEPVALRKLVQRGLENDLLLLSGGVSAGEYDLVEDILSGLGAEFLFTGVQIQPGKPLVFGRVRQNSSQERFTYFFGLPGNPISTMVTFELFARPIVRALSGASQERIRSSKARLANPVKVKSGLTRFLPARLCGAWDDVQVEQVPWQGSGDIAASARADCLLVIPPDREQFEAGEMMTVIHFAIS